MSQNIVKKYLHSPIRVFEWFEYSHSYLQAAKAVAAVYADNERMQSVLFPPLVFNIRHALELMLKFLSYATGGEPQNLSHHDVHKLFLSVEKAFGTLDDESLSFAASGLGVEKDLLSNALGVSITQVESLVEKYSSYTFFPAPVDDLNNVLLRYPTNTTSGPFILNGLHTTLSAAEVPADIEKLLGFLLFVVGTSAKIENGVHWLAEA